MGIILKIGGCAAVLLLAAVSVRAQQTIGEINGKVVNSRDNQPLAIVQVELAGTTLRVVTGDDGTFKIPGVPPGNYVLQVSAVGYYVARQDFALAAGETKSFDVVLTSNTAKFTEEVKVSADPFDTTDQSGASVFVLEGDERKNLASVLADDPLRAIQSAPGVSSNNDFSSEFSVRGAPFNRIGLYLDGVLLHSPFHTLDGQPDNGSLSIFNGDTTADMTLYEGAWPVRYSDRTAGILAVETREGSRDKIQGNVNASASNAGFLLEGPIHNKRGSWLVNFRKSYLQYILNRIDFGDSAPFVFGFTDVQEKLTYDLTPRHTLSLSFFDGASDVDRTQFRDELGVSSIMTSGFHSTMFNLGSRYAPNQRVLVTNHFAWSGDHGNVDNRDNVRLLHQSYSEWTWHGDVSVIWNEKSRLDFGAQVRREQQDTTNNQFVYSPVLTETQDLSRGSAHQAGAYIQESVSPFSGQMHFTVGVRQDGHSESQVETTSPYASLSLGPWKRTRFEVDWGQYSQFPELNQYRSSFAQGVLLPERATHYEASVEERLNDRMRLRVEFYDRQDRDILARPLLDPRLLATGVVVNADPNAPLFNSQRGYSRGFQIFLQRRSANGFTGWVSYAYGRNVVRDGSLGVKFPSDYDQRHTFNLYASRRLKPTVNLSAHVTYGSGMPLPGFYQLGDSSYLISQNRNGLRAPVYQRTDLRLNKAYVKQRVKTTVFGEIVNVTNHKNQDFDSPGPYEPTTGRTYPKFFSMFPILPSVGMMLEF
jgi:hypothetical protein